MDLDDPRLQLGLTITVEALEAIRQIAIEHRARVLGNL
jgi:hypothetical protein